jgi:hypothetical protein
MQSLNRNINVGKKKRKKQKGQRQQGRIGCRKQLHGEMTKRNRVNEEKNNNIPTRKATQRKAEAEKRKNEEKKISDEDHNTFQVSAAVCGKKGKEGSPKHTGNALGPLKAKEDKQTFYLPQRPTLQTLRKKEKIQSPMRQILAQLKKKLREK